MAHRNANRLRLPPTLSAVGATFCLLAFGLATPARAVCNPDGTANEVIGCIDDDNIATKRQLSRFYPAQYLDSLDVQCRAEFPGGGSGGHEDRAICLQRKLKDAAAKVGFPRK
jgi:hypothetical protein